MLLLQRCCGTAVVMATAVIVAASVAVARKQRRRAGGCCLRLISCRDLSSVLLFVVGHKHRIRHSLNRKLLTVNSASRYNVLTGNLSFHTLCMSTYSQELFSSSEVADPNEIQESCFGDVPTRRTWLHKAQVHHSFRPVCMELFCCKGTNA